MNPTEFAAFQAGNQTEAQLQACIVRLARLNGWLVYHTRDSRGSQKGFPDLVLVHAARGITMFRELKTMKGRPTPEQKKWIAALAEAGADVALWRPVDWFDGSVIDLLTGSEIEQP